MDYEIDWRDGGNFAARLEVLKAAYPHGKFRLHWESSRLLLYGLSSPQSVSAWVCEVSGTLTPETKRNIENFARARYGL